MFIINLYRFVLGYVVLKIYGDFPERMLNLCAKNGIIVWSVKRTKDHIRFCVSINDFKRFRRIRPKSVVKIKILKKCGLNIIFSRYKHRFGIPLGVIVFFVILKVLSLFVWNIEVVGAKSIDSNEVIGLCEKQGIYIGSFIKNIDTKISKDKILIDSDKLAWAAINIEGSTVTVNVSEVKSEIPDKKPSNIVSDYDAIIKKITITSGNSQVYLGQAVSKGDLLISGTVDVGDRVNFVRSSGVVLGEIEEKIILEKNYIQKVKHFTGKENKKYVFEFFGLKTPLFLGETRGEHLSNYSKKPLKFLGKNMPISLYCKHSTHFVSYKKEFSKAFLLSQIEGEFEQQIKKRKLQDITVLGREIYEENNAVRVEYSIKYTKNIGKSENLLISTLN
ncbi:MAG: sporulation protein YqfD [Acutalibacteraceae bacterium]|nr:sporulation protein YqfD [Acutalibacteraceae bacterium]